MGWSRWVGLGAPRRLVSKGSLWQKPSLPTTLICQDQQLSEISFHDITSPPELLSSMLRSFQAIDLDTHSTPQSSLLSIFHSSPSR
mmetsp:Transcript_57604/g.124554  ORF Transcript_57604/g.124554 Transcript_57604/m.124554 type:complete len:86 (+) Transcript_57604:294-551(+)